MDPSAPQPRLPRAAALGSEAAAVMKQLLGMLRPEVAGSTAAAAAVQQQQQGGATNGQHAALARYSGPVVIVAIKSVAALALARPSFLGRALPVLIRLAKEVSSAPM
jgi:hypothetical protein